MQHQGSVCSQTFHVVLSVPALWPQARGQRPELLQLAPRVLVPLCTAPCTEKPRHLQGVTNPSCLALLPGSEALCTVLCTGRPGCTPEVVDLSHLERLPGSELHAPICAPCPCCLPGFADLTQLEWLPEPEPYSPCCTLNGAEALVPVKESSGHFGVLASLSGQLFPAVLCPFFCLFCPPMHLPMCWKPSSIYSLQRICPPKSCCTS